METDGGRETLNEFVEVQRENNLEWCRLVPAEEIEKAWREGAAISDVFAWPESRAKCVMEGLE